MDRTMVADSSTSKRDLSFYWNDAITVEYLNNNYLPSVEHVISYFRALCYNEYI